MSARRGTEIVEDSAEHGRTTQVCDFDDGMTANMGAGRIPYHHRRVLHYCEELGVPLQVYVFQSQANLYQSDMLEGGEALPRRGVEVDARGYVAELLSKAARGGALDDELSPEDIDRL